MVKLTKAKLYQALQRNKVTRDELVTVLSSCQQVINSRPLTYTYSGRNDGSDGDIMPITPNLFLKMYNSPNLVIKSVEEDPLWTPETTVYREDLNKSLELQQKIYEHFKDIWLKDYLLSLRETSRQMFQGKWENRLRKGDVVLYNPNDGSKRPFYKMAIVEDLYFVDGDDRCRSVELRFPNGHRSRHSVSHIFALEIQSARDGTRVPEDKDLIPESEDLESQLPSQNQESSVNPPITASNSRPRRAAAIKGQNVSARMIDEGSV